MLNASIAGEEIVYHDDVNLGIAVALDEGLIVPVIRQAQRLSVEGLAAAIADVAGRAREGRLVPDDVAGGTFTITNPGQFGAVLATPIINQPQVAILDLEAVVKRPVVVEGEDGDAIAIRPMSYLCMSWDHRALDGAEAARFLAAHPRAARVGRAELMDADRVRGRRRPPRLAQRRGHWSIAVHSTRLGPALGGARMWHYETPGDGVADAMRLARGDDVQGGGRGARPRRRQGRDLRPRPAALPRASDGARCCSTSATRSSRSRVATSPPRTSAPAPPTWR